MIFIEVIQQIVILNQQIQTKKKRIRKKIILKIQILLQILRKFLLFLNLLPV